MSGSIIGDSELTVVGLLAALLLIVAREAFAFLSNKNLQSSEIKLKVLSEQIEQSVSETKELKSKVDNVAREVHTMYEWHDKDDQDGVKVWYIRQSLENVLRDNASAVAAIAKNSELQTRLLEEMLESQKILIREQSQLMREVRDGFSLNTYYLFMIYY
jgi:hypothetical protein